MKPQTLIMLVVALGCGLAAMVMTQRFLTVPTVEKPKGTEVVVAAVNIQPGTELNETLVKMVEWPNDVVPETALTDMKEVLGRSVRFPLGANEAITMAKLAAEGIGPGLEPIIEAGKRAMSVPIKTHESAAGFVTPGSKVDIVMISRGNGADGKAKTILQNVRVIAVNHSIADNPEEASKGSVVEMVTFLLTLEEAESLALAQNTGAIQLILRNPLEEDFVKTKGVTRDELLRGTSRFSKLNDEKPEDGATVADGPSALSGFLEKLLSQAPKEETQPEETAEPTEELDPIVVQTPQSPPEKKKRLVYRDLEGNVLMEVVLDAEDKIVESLDGLLEDVEDEAKLAKANGLPLPTSVNPHESTLPSHPFTPPGGGHLDELGPVDLDGI